MRCWQRARPPACLDWATYLGSLGDSQSIDRIDRARGRGMVGPIYNGRNRQDIGRIVLWVAASYDLLVVLR
jgi:hypothetical protein